LYNFPHFGGILKERKLTILRPCVNVDAGGSRHLSSHKTLGVQGFREGREVGMPRNLKKLWRYTLTVGVCFVCAVLMKIYIDRHLEGLRSGQGDSAGSPARSNSPARSTSSGTGF